MDDYKTRDIVSYALSRIGYNYLSRYVKNDYIDLEPYIRLIKRKLENFSDLKEMINYYL